MRRNISFDFAQGGGSDPEFLIGTILFEPTHSFTIGTREVLPIPTTVELTNGVALMEDVTVSPPGPVPAWGYKVTITDGVSQRAFTRLVGVPAGTGAIDWTELNVFTEIIPPGVTGDDMQNWADTALQGADRAEAAADRAEAPTDGMNASLIGNPASQTYAALKSTFARRLLVDVRDYGAVGDGVTDDAPALQAAFDMAKIAKATIEFQPGAVYRVNSEIVVTRGTTINGHGATIRRYHPGYILMNGVRGASYNGYTGHGDIHVRDLTLDARGGVNTAIASNVAFAHADTLSFERVTFLDATSHAYEMNSSRNVLVDSCKFLGYRNGDGNNFVEALQLDNATETGFSAFGANDATATKNVTIRNCTFGPSASLSAHPRGIGTHASRVDRPHEDIVIDGCKFSGHADLAIRAYNWQSVRIINNFCDSPGGFVQINNPVVGDGTTDNTKNAAGIQTGASVPNRGFYIAGNTSLQKVGVAIFGQLSARVENVQIVSNRFTANNDHRGVWCGYVDGVVVSGNSLRGQTVGIDFAVNSVEYRVVVSNNEIRNASEHGIYISQGREIVVSANTTLNCGSVGIEGSHIRISGATDRFAVTGNMGMGDSTYTSIYGIYCAGDVINGTVTANVFTSVGTTARIRVPSTASLVKASNVE